MSCFWTGICVYNICQISKLVNRKQYTHHREAGFHAVGEPLARLNTKVYTTHYRGGSTILPEGGVVSAAGLVVGWDKMEDGRVGIASGGDGMTARGVGMTEGGDGTAAPAVEAERERLKRERGRVSHALGYQWRDPGFGTIEQSSTAAVEVERARLKGYYFCQIYCANEATSTKDTRNLA
jgi:hypothetical protein